MAQTPRFSHLFLLLFLGSGFFVLLCLLLLAYGALRKSRVAARLGAGGAFLGVSGYGALLLGVGIFTPQRVLSPGEWKVFCEADCHIAYSVADARTAATLGPESRAAVASGVFVIVRVKTWFDEHSIASFRGYAPLKPSPRTVTLVDDRGKSFSPSVQAGAILGEPSTPMTQPLRPGESYLTNFVFDLPQGTKNLRLLISDDDPLDSLIVDHENSPFHGKILLALWPPTPSSSPALR